MSDYVSQMPPRFPPEVWSITLSNLRERKSQDELTYLWTIVRHVCRQFKEEVEDIFRTEHLSKTWLHFNTGTYYSDYDTFSRPRAEIWAKYEGQHLEAYTGDDFDVQLHFARFDDQEPDRAMFVPGPGGTDWPDLELEYQRATFRCMREKGGLGGLGKADKYRPSDLSQIFSLVDEEIQEPVPVFEPVLTEGLFTIQIRGGMNDCAIPGLRINQDHQEVSLEWRDLFTRFFGEQKMMVDVLNNDPIGSTFQTWTPDDDRLVRRHDQRHTAELNALPVDLDPRIRDIAHRDLQEKHRRELEANRVWSLLERLDDPIGTWRESAGRFIGKDRTSIGRYKLKRNADLQSSLNDEGAVYIEYDREGDRRARRESNEWGVLTSACDFCRLNRMACDKGKPQCSSCKNIMSQCSYRLSEINGHERIPRAPVSASFHPECYQAFVAAGMINPSQLNQNQQAMFQRQQTIAQQQQIQQAQHQAMMKQLRIQNQAQHQALVQQKRIQQQAQQQRAQEQRMLQQQRQTEIQIAHRAHSLQQNQYATAQPMAQYNPTLPAIQKAQAQYQLAKLRQHFPAVQATSNSLAQQDHQMRQMLIEQQQKKRELLLRHFDGMLNSPGENTAHSSVYTPVNAASSSGAGQQQKCETPSDYFQEVRPIINRIETEMNDAGQRLDKGDDTFRALSDAHADRNIRHLCPGTMDAIYNTQPSSSSSHATQVPSDDMQRVQMTGEAFNTPKVEHAALQPEAQDQSFHSGPTKAREELNYDHTVADRQDNSGQKVGIIDKGKGPTTNDEETHNKGSNVVDIGQEETWLQDHDWIDNFLENGTDYDGWQGYIEDVQMD